MTEKHVLDSGAEISFYSDTSKQLPFIIVIPGGGYNHYGSKEQESIAYHFNKLGFNAAVLYYHIAPCKFPEGLVDLAQAVAYIRTNCKKVGADPDKIIALGFSAGGHLAGSLGAFWNTSLLRDQLCKTEEEKSLYSPALYRPDYLCLCYPVISADSRICHRGSFQCLTENLTKEEAEDILRKTKTTGSGDSVPFWKELLRDALSLEKHVTADFPPVFMWHTTEDETVIAENTIRMAESLKAAGVNFEYHLFTKGAHGLALAPDTAAQCWSQLFIEWLKTQFSW